MDMSKYAKYFGTMPDTELMKMVAKNEGISIGAAASRVQRERMANNYPKFDKKKNNPKFELILEEYKKRKGMSHAAIAEAISNKVGYSKIYIRLLLKDVEVTGKLNV